MKKLLFVFVIGISAAILSSCASNKNGETITTTTTTTTPGHQQGAGLPSQSTQTMQTHGM
jgi:hypothetical protein